MKTSLIASLFGVTLGATGLTIAQLFRTTARILPTRETWAKAPSSDSGRSRPRAATWGRSQD